MSQEIQARPEGGEMTPCEIRLERVAKLVQQWRQHAVREHRRGNELDANSSQSYASQSYAYGCEHTADACARELESVLAKEPRNKKCETQAERKERHGNKPKCPNCSWMAKTLLDNFKSEVFDEDREWLFGPSDHFTVGELQEMADIPALGWVYFIAAGDLIKIGVTGNLDGRLQGLAAVSPVPIRLLGSIHRTLSAARKLENELHERCRDKNHHNEWFSLTEAEVSALVEEYDAVRA